MSDAPPEQIEYVVSKMKQKPIYRRPGCIIGLIIWFVFLLLPFFMFILAIQGNITIKHRGDIPAKDEYPWFQVKLISEIDYRGISITRSTIHREDNNALCMENHIDFLLWQGEGESAMYCQCFSRETEQEDWQSFETTPGACK